MLGGVFLPLPFAKWSDMHIDIVVYSYYHSYSLLCPWISVPKSVNAGNLVNQYKLTQ